MSFIKSKRSLDLIYSDVWVLAFISCFDNVNYYIIYMDYFTKYVWPYLLRYKSNFVLYLFSSRIFETSLRPK